MAPVTPREKRIKVCVRIRPFTKNEAVKAGGKAAWTWHENTIYQQIFPAQIPQRRLEKRSGGSTTSSITSASDAANLPSSYSFDLLFPPASRTQTVYDETVKDAINAAMEGFHSSVFLYGQTSTGKTYTMQGNKSDPGVVQLSVTDIFRHIAQHPEMEFLLRFSYLEIYNERIYDLLAGGAKSDVKIFEVGRSSSSASTGSGSASTAVRDTGACKDVIIKGLREEIVVTIDHVLSLVDVGNQHRHMATTESNDQSSRSHVIFRMVIESQLKRSRDRSTPSNAPVRSATLNLIDLAGSEGVRLANTTGQHLEEGKYINRSLLTLGHIIWKLSRSNSSSSKHGSSRHGAPVVAPPSHLPYRNSKLTRILQPSLGGQAQIAVICTIAPSVECLAETHNTLKFASRARRLRNRAAVNETTGESVLLRKYRVRMRELEDQLASLERRKASVSQRSNSGATQAAADRATIDARQMELKFAINNINRVILNSGAAAHPMSSSDGRTARTASVSAQQQQQQQPSLSQSQSVQRQHQHHPSVRSTGSGSSTLLRGRPRPPAIKTQPQELVVVPERVHDDDDDNDEVDTNNHGGASNHDANDDRNETRRANERVGRSDGERERMTNANNDGGNEDNDADGDDDEETEGGNSRTNSNRTLVGSGGSRASTKTLPLSSSSSLPTTDGGDFEPKDDAIEEEPESEDRAAAELLQPQQRQRRASLTTMLRSKYEDEIIRMDQRAGRWSVQSPDAIASQREQLKEFVRGLEIAEAEQATRMSKIQELELENRQLRQILQSREDELQALKNGRPEAETV